MIREGQARSLCAKKLCRKGTVYISLVSLHVCKAPFEQKWNVSGAMVASGAIRYRGPE